MNLTRRNLLSLLPGLALPVDGLARPRPSAEPQRFLFVFCNGGWDTSYVFTPFEELGLDAPADTAVSEASGVRFVDHPAQPAVRTFFETFGSQACVINGIEVRSITHERCRRIILTGSSESGQDDWPAVLAAHGGQDLLCPHLVIGGPTFSSKHTRKIVRVGQAGQLTDLLDGGALAQSDLPATLPSPSVETLGDAYVRQRAAALAQSGVRGRLSQLGEMYGSALDDATALSLISGDLNLETSDQGCTNDLAGDASLVFDAFERGLSRCAIVQSEGWCSTSWDSHQGISRQAEHYDLLFSELSVLMTDLSERSTASGARLADHVTVVVFSEMGRHPVLNSWGGKDHWTYTSAMLLGAGVAGGQVIGGLRTDATGAGVDLSSGQVTDSGVDLLPGHLGATLMVLGGHDPGELVPGYDPIIAAIG